MKNHAFYGNVEKYCRAGQATDVSTFQRKRCDLRDEYLRKTQTHTDNICFVFLVLKPIVVVFFTARYGL